MEQTCVASPFEIAVKTGLLKKGMSQTDLFERIHEKTGLYCDHGYMCKIFHNPRLAPKIRTAIGEILEIELPEIEEPEEQE